MMSNPHDEDPKGRFVRPYAKRSAAGDNPKPEGEKLKIERYRDRKRFCVCGPRLKHGGQTLYFIGTKKECLDYLKGVQGTAKLKTPPLHPDRA